MSDCGVQNYQRVKRVGSDGKPEGADDVGIRQMARWTEVDQGSDGLVNGVPRVSCILIYKHATVAKSYFQLFTYTPHEAHCCRDRSHHWANPRLQPCYPLHCPPVCTKLL